MKWMGCGLLITCVLFASGANAVDDWTQQYPTSAPSARQYHDMAYIDGGKALLFGGWIGSNDDETWIYDVGANTWTQMFPASEPPARREHTMAYTGTDKVLLFGGYDDSGLDDETWVYDLSDSTWTQISPLSKPSPRYAYGMAYIGDDQVLLFGGNTGAPLFRNDETWVYDLSDSTWTQKNPSSKPSARTGHAMAYIGTDQVLLFGGYDTGGFSDETWVYDLSANTWTQKDPSQKPSARRGQGMAHIGGDWVLIFGGDDGSRIDETWVYDLSDDSWILDVNTAQPSPRTLPGFSETSVDGSTSLVLFGGTVVSGSDDQTWTYYPVPDAPQMSVTYPNGGEVLADSVTITWTASDPDPGETALLMVHLDYSDNAGGSWSIIDSNETNDGNYFWDISGLPDGFEYLVRVAAFDTTGLSDRDTSDAVFTIYVPNPPQVTITAPNDGENVGDSTTITWMATDPDPGETNLLLIDLDYSDNAGASWSAIDSNQANDGAYFWDLYGLYSGADYLVRITATDTTGRFDSDTCDAVFTIRNPDPHISSIDDVPEDQGRQVAVMWDRSYLDEYPNQVITYYSIWRKFPGGSKMEFLGEEWDGSLPKDLTQLICRRIERKDASGETKTGYWELVGTQEAHYLEGYSYIAPTMYDSSASGPAYFSFFVSAQTADPFVFYDSAPDSSYSVDNVSPAKTQVGIMPSRSAKGAVNTIWLFWTQVTTGHDGSPEQGAIDYRIYCDETFDFAPGPGNLVTTTSDLSYPHTDSRIGDPLANLYYLVMAVDQSGNESAVSNVVGEFDRDLNKLK